MLAKKYKLKDGNQIPSLGFGTWKLLGKSAYDSVLYALEIGYRHIDTADIYRNHKQVGKAIRESNIKRNDIFITTKVFRHQLRKNRVISAGKRFLDELETDYLDLLLIHWPNRNVPINETLEGFRTLKEEGIIKSYGVSNFSVENLKKSLEIDENVVVDQIDYHPSLNESRLLEFCRENNVIVTAYSPLGKGKDLKIDLIRELSEKYGKSGAQIIINWIISKGMVAIPKSSKKEHIKDNYEALDWELSSDDVKKIDLIDGNRNLFDPQI